ncbi:MAG: hypothetical protein EBZ14_06510 [Gammaproteobacteria bacterium]|nr:hypothetical protein [Gammaproteobacteria bacterium]
MIPNALTNDRLLRALRREPVDCTPIWIMRQAGRYLPEYRATRERAGNFLTLCKTPELACEVTLQPLERFDLDAAILFSDILTIPDAMGLGLTLHEGEGPRFARPIRSTAEIDALGVPDPEKELAYVMGQWLSRIVSIGCDAIGCDWTTSLSEARLAVQDQVALQGNLDPAVLYASPERIRAAVSDVLSDFGPGPGHIFNLGHGVTPGVNPEHVRVLVDAVHELSRQGS